MMLTFYAENMAAENTPAIWSIGTKDRPVYGETPLMPLVNLALLGKDKVFF